MGGKKKKSRRFREQKQTNETQLKLLEQYFQEYCLMNHYQLWLTARLNNSKTPKGLDLKIMLNPILKLFRKSK